VKLVNTQTQAVFYDKLTFLFLEMPKFTKERHQLSSNTDKWLYVLKNMHKLAEMPSEVQEGVFSKLFEQCEIVNYNAEDSMAYEESVKIYNDWYSITQTAKKKGIEEGITIGKAEGLAEGIRITVENAIK
jgi:predicted transposase/invertase (TIGR01784 family)